MLKNNKNDIMKINIDIAIKDYFIGFFQINFSMTPTYHLISKDEAVFGITVNNLPELFVVKYSSLFANKSSLIIKSTADINFLEQVFNLFFNANQINYYERLNYLRYQIELINLKFKFFSDIQLDDDHFFSFKTSVNKEDNRVYYSLCTKRYFRLPVNSNLYNVKERTSHFLTGRFDLDLHVKSNTILSRCQLSSSSLDDYATDSVIMLTDTIDTFEGSVKRCKKYMTAMILAECFNDIVDNYGISLRKLQKMTEDNIKPYADLVKMLRI